MSGPASSPDPETEALLERLAERLVRLRMSVPAILFLESIKPLNFVGSQFVGFLEPAVRALFRWDEVEKLRMALEDRGTLERLIVRIEEAESRARTRPPEDAP